MKGAAGQAWRIAQRQHRGYRYGMSRAATAKPTASAEGKAARGKGARDKPSRLRRLVRIALKILAVLVLIPAVLVPVYTAIPPISTVMIWTRMTSGPIERDWVGFDDIAKVAVISVMVSEDGQFCAH